MSLSYPFPLFYQLLRKITGIITEQNSTSRPLNTALQNLTGRIANDEKDAFEQFYQQTRPHIYRYIFHRTKDQTTALDLTQEVFIKFWDARTKLAQVTNSYAYLKTIAHNHLASHFKAMDKQQFIQINSDSNLTDIPCPEDTDLDDLHALVHALIEQLPERQRQVFRLCKISGLKRAQVAIKLGITEHTVKEHLKEAMKTIRLKLSS